MRGLLALAGDSQSTRSRRVGPAPGAGGIDHRACFNHLAAIEVQFERQLVAALRPDFVEILAANRDHSRIQAQVRRDRRVAAKRRHVAIDQVVPGGQRVIGRRLPPGRLEQLPSHFVGGVAPRREHRDLPPLADGRAHFGAGFEDDERNAPCHQVRRRGEAHRASPDDGHR